MRALLWIIAIFAFAAGVGMLASANEGYVLMVLPPWRAQASLNLVVIALIAGFFSIHFLVRLISRTLDLPGRVGRFRIRRRQEKAARATRDALAALFEGRFQDALKEARVAHACSGKSPEAALLAARAAHGLADGKRFAEWMEQAGNTEGGRVARLLTEAELAVADGRFEDAEGALATLRKGGYQGVQAATMQLAVARALGRWEQVPEAVRALLAARRISDEEARSLLGRAHLERLAALGSDREAQAVYWRGLPKEDLGDARFVAQAIPVLAAAGQGAIARKVVERLLDKEWNGALARGYNRCAGEGEEARDALSRAEGWLQQHPDDAGLLYSLGRQCMQAQIWGKAQSYLEHSLAKDPAADVHFALAELMERLERPVEAKAQYREAARLALEAAS